MVKHGGVEVRMVAPVPFFPSGSTHFGRYAAYAHIPSQEIRCRMQVTHPRYPVIPKLGMTMAPWLMVASLLGHLQQIKQSGFDFDLIDAYYLYPDGVAAAAFGMLLRKPVLLTAFGSDVSLLPNFRMPRKSILWAAKRAGQMTAVCQALKDEVARVGVTPEHVHVIRHGVDLELFQPQPDRASCRLRLGLTRPTIVSVGHLIERKGHDIAVRALELLPDCDLLIIGDGPEEGRLRRLVQSLRLSNRVRFVGHVSQPVLAELLGAADVLLNCSDREGIANVLLEAMACGTPVAATPVWGSPEVITVPEAGILLQDRTALAVAQGIAQLLERSCNRNLTRQHAEKFAWGDTAREHIFTIRRMLASNSSQVESVPACSESAVVDSF